MNRVEYLLKQMPSETGLLTPADVEHKVMEDEYRATFGLNPLPIFGVKTNFAMQTLCFEERNNQPSCHCWGYCDCKNRNQ